MIKPSSSHENDGSVRTISGSLTLTSKSVAIANVVDEPCIVGQYPSPGALPRVRRGKRRSTPFAGYVCHESSSEQSVLTWYHQPNSVWRPKRPPVDSQSKRRTSSGASSFSALPQQAHSTSAAPSSRSTTRPTMTSSLTTFLEADPCWNTRNCTSGIS